ncbi:serine hydrolase domain-containing protein [Microbacterium sp. ASV49]|uniref:Serine hydrolase domain-containing protein n=1 Tax=Microbacterium candidum TaxID=3041922 RepID=A0ABT7MZ53_9MICO|nr:serine hydrolase domain-containing protein [Microbacterium sp. ASV49]MDL9979729.1 serine hydrolase domain-containing protein [Microbacterium sp. ASV49]
MPETLSDVLIRHVRAGTIPGAVGAYGDDDPVAIGRVSPDGAEISPNAVFRIQSMTKAVTAVATLRLVQDGILALDDPVDAWLPELSAPLALPHPDAPLDEARPALRPITVRHLLTNTSGYGMMTTDSALRTAMVEAGVEAGAEPVPFGAQEWLDRMAALPLAFDPGDGWRYHHSFGVLGILLGRVGHGTAEEVLRATVFDPAGMVDTGFTVRPGEEDRLLAAFRRTAEGLTQTEPAGAGFSVAPAPFDVSHSELVSTVADYRAFLRALRDGLLIERELVAELRRDQVPAAAKAEDSFFPGFWAGTGWGYGVSIVTDGAHRGRFGWSGGLGTDFFVDPDGTICVVMAQVEMDDRVFGLLGELQGVTGS